MKITLAKTAGFCFGVSRAVEMTRSMAESGKKVATMGPLIHNTQAVKSLEDLGVVTVEEGDPPREYRVVLRSHGVEKSVYEDLEEKGFEIRDATCPYVKKIHRIARKTGAEGKTLLVAGDKNHPEVQGIVSYTDGEVFVFDGPEELSDWLDIPENREKPANAVAQTTFLMKKWVECANLIKKVCTNCEIFDTICRATDERQAEATLLAKENDLMVVIGGRHSSNTQKLVEVCQDYCPVVSIETAKELRKEFFENIQNVGVTAGASTPAFIIQEVLDNMSEEIREENENFEKMLEEPYASQPKLFRGAKVKGVVTSITDNEVLVDLGRAHSGVIKFSELSDDPSAKPEELVKKGDELNLIVVKDDDQDGTTELSKKKYDAIEGSDAVARAAETGEVLTAKVVQAVKGGLVAYVKNTRIFIPASLSGPRNQPLEPLVGTEQDLKIIEYSREGNRRKIIGSIKAVKDEEARAKREKFWDEIEVGKHYDGVVKSLTRYGAFVDLGGVDGLVHISELTWEKIRHPSEVVSVGDVIDVFVKSYDREAGRISLGHKKEEDNPWTKLQNEYAIGSIIKGKVVSITGFGVFVRILPGIDGLVHISEVSYDRVEDRSTVVKKGQEIDVKLLNVDFDAHKVSLSIKQTKEPPVKSEEE